MTDQSLACPPDTRVPTPDEKPLLELAETFGPLRLSRTTGYQLRASGNYPVEVLQQGDHYFVRTADLRRYLGI